MSWRVSDLEETALVGYGAGVWWWLVAQPSGIYALRASYKSYFYMIMGFI